MWGVPGNALIDFEEFLTLIAVRSQHQHSAAEIVEAFQLFDVEGTGYVDIPRFRAAMKELVRSGANAHDMYSSPCGPRCAELLSPHCVRYDELNTVLRRGWRMRSWMGWWRRPPTGTPLPYSSTTTPSSPKCCPCRPCREIVAPPPVYRVCIRLYVVVWCRAL